MTPNELVLTFRGLHFCVKFGENRQRNATVRVMTHGQTDRHTHTHTHTHTHRQTDANRFYYLPHAICYSYRADKNNLSSAVAVYCFTRNYKNNSETYAVDSYRIT